MATLTKSTGTVTLSGTAEKVTLPAAYGWVWVKNMSDADMFAGLSADISEGADGVMVIPAGECGRIQTDGFNSIYLVGTGSALVVAQNYADCPFKVGGKGGESPDLSAYAKTADVPNIKVNAAINADTVGGLAANEIATNPNLLINPDFKINQRGETDFSVTYHQGTPISQSQKYTVDRWRIMDGRANISNGKFALTGTIIQVLENSIGGDFTATVSAESGTATASYDDSTKTFSIVGNNAVLNWAKLEYGSNATQFIPPDTATELLKCERFFRTFDSSFVLNTIGSFHHNGNNQFLYIFDTPMRVAPDLIFTDCGVRRISEPYVDVSVTSFNSLSTKRVLYIYCQMDTLYDDAIFVLKSDNGLAADAEIY